MRNKNFKLLALTAAISLIAAASATPTMARGGGGGGRGGGGFGGRGGFDRGFGGDMDRFDRGFDDGPRDDSGFRNDDGSGFRDNSAKPFNPPQVSDADLRAGADHTYGSFAADKGYGLGGASKSYGGLASDGGFGRVAAADTARNYGIPSTSKVSGADLASRAQSVRGDYTNYGAFGRDWWGAHTGSWYYPGWRDGWAWGGVGWGDLGGYWGMDTEPVEYDYGNNITYQNDEVYYGSQPTATASTYYAQAQSLAESYPATAPAPTKATANDWKPLGVYSLTQDANQHDCYVSAGSQ